MKIWVITVCTKASSEEGRFNMGFQRTWGFFSNKDDALYSLHNNVTDIWETIYHYALLECYEEGTDAEFVSVQWFEFDKDKNGYFEIDKPDGAPDMYGIVMG